MSLVNWLSAVGDDPEHACDEADVGFQLHSMMRSRVLFLTSLNGSSTGIWVSDRLL
jgi:hypothetical protein